MDPARHLETGTYIARQPIYNQQLGVHAYELLFRTATSPDSATASDAATSHVMLSAFGEIGLDALVGSRLATINMTWRLMEELRELAVPAGRMILDLPPSLPCDEDAVQLLRGLSGQGYVLALDDYVPGTSRDALLPVVHQVKIDTASSRPDDLRLIFRGLKTTQVEKVAKKVETLEDYEFLRDLGFDYFQGYFLSRPRVFRAVNLPTGKLTVLRLLARLQQPEMDVHELQHLIAQDPGLAFKLLKLINSPFFGLNRQVDSLARAILILGHRKLVTWACMLVLSGLEDRPAGLVHLCLQRAGLCERIARMAGRRPVERYFTAGLFSALDLVMERPLPQVIGPLPLDDEIKRALLEGEGELGEVVACARACETDQVESVAFADLLREDIMNAMLEAGQWADEVQSVSISGTVRR